MSVERHAVRTRRDAAASTNRADVGHYLQRGRRVDAPRARRRDTASQCASLLSLYKLQSYVKSAICTLYARGYHSHRAARGRPCKLAQNVQWLRVCIAGATATRTTNACMTCARFDVAATRPHNRQANDRPRKVIQRANGQISRGHECNAASCERSWAARAPHSRTDVDARLSARLVAARRPGGPHA